MYRLLDILKADTGCSSCKKSKRLYEAYSEKAVQRFLDRFKEEADDLNIDITDGKLISYIKTFDRIKDKLPSDRRDLDKWKVGEFIRFVTTGKGAEKDETEEIDITPDVVYHNDDDTIVIYNGSTEGRCVKYGRGEKWCITKSSFPSYRYNIGRSYPTFYLAKNNNLPPTDKLSFVAIQVKDPEKTSENERYVYTNRDNKPYESNPMSFDKLVSEVPWLKNIPDLKSTLKYIPLSSAEKLSHGYRNNPITYKEWTKLPYQVKEQYLVIRKEVRSRYTDNNIFTDISDEEFVREYLKKYPDILKFVAETPDVIDSKLLVKNLGNFSDSARKSIIANLHVPIDANELGSSAIPFDVKKLLVRLKKWKLEPEEKLYTTQDGDTIVKLTLGDDFKMGLYQAEDDYPNVKINKRTSKFLLDYPELSKIPLNTLLDLSEKGLIDSSIPKKVLDDARKDPESVIAIKKTADGEIAIDSNTLTSYRIEGDKIIEVPFTDERVQDAFKDTDTDTDAFKKNVLNLFTGQPKNLPATVNTTALATIIGSMPYAERTMPIETGWSSPPTRESVALVDPASGNVFFMKSTPETGDDFVLTVKSYEKNKVSVRQYLTQGQYAAYFDYLRDKNLTIDDEKLLRIMKTGVGNRYLANFVNANPPLNPNNVLKAVVDQEGTVYLVNTANRRESYKISPASGNLVTAPLSQGRYNQLVGAPEEPQQATAAPGQVPGVRWQQPAPTGDINIANTMATVGATNQFSRIPARDLRRLNINNGASLNIRTDGGARRRNQLLGNAGQVEAAIAALTSRIYIIRLANGQRVVSIKVYPGNREYLLIPGQAALEISEPSQLLTALRQRDLAEVRRYLVKSYLGTNPTNLSEFKQILRKHINKKHEKTAN